MDRNFFSKQAFAAEELKKLRASVARSLGISARSREPEVKFHFAYMALIKIGIYLVARRGYRVKSRPGHHQAIIGALAGLLKNDDVALMGDKMRRSRNMDFYGADGMITETEAAKCFEFVEAIYKNLG